MPVKGHTRPSSSSTWLRSGMERIAPFFVVTM